MASNFATPPGIVADPENPHGSLLPALIGVLTVCPVLATAFTVFRLVAKKTISKFSIEDYLSITTWIIFIGYSALFGAQSAAGIGRHIWDVHPEQSVTIAKESWAIELMYCVVTMLAKVTLLLQMQKTFGPTRTGAIYIACQIMIWVIVIFNTAMFFAILCQCIPVKKNWEPTLEYGHCIDTYAGVISTSVGNAVFDFPILIIPIWAISRLQMSLKKKVESSFIFAIGVIANTSSLGRLAYTVKGINNPDVTYVIAQVGIWAIVEIMSIIICTSIPFMPRFFQVVFKRGVSTRTTIPDSRSKSFSDQQRLTSRSSEMFQLQPKGEKMPARLSNSDLERSMDAPRITDEPVNRISGDIIEGNTGLQMPGEGADSTILKTLEVQQWREIRATPASTHVRPGTADGMEKW